MCKFYGTDYIIQKLTPEYNSAVASLIRHSLKSHGLDIPGTVYFDPELDTLTDYYDMGVDRDFYVLVDQRNSLLGCIGFAETSLFPNCAELQKLYIDDSAKGHGLSYLLISFIEEKMARKGYKKSYLETHSNLQRAIYVYEKCGYVKIPRPDTVGHGTMDHFYIKDISPKGSFSFSVNRTGD